MIQSHLPFCPVAKISPALLFFSSWKTQIHNSAVSGAIKGGLSQLAGVEWMNAERKRSGWLQENVRGNSQGTPGPSDCC